MVLAMYRKLAESLGFDHGIGIDDVEECAHSWNTDMTPFTFRAILATLFHTFHWEHSHEFGANFTHAHEVLDLHLLGILFNGSAALASNIEAYTYRELLRERGFTFSAPVLRFLLAVHGADQESDDCKSNHEVDEHEADGQETGGQETDQEEDDQEEDDHEEDDQEEDDQEEDDQEEDDQEKDDQEEDDQEEDGALDPVETILSLFFVEQDSDDEDYSASESDDGEFDSESDSEHSSESDGGSEADTACANETDAESNCGTEDADDSAFNDTQVKLDLLDSVDLHNLLAEAESFSVSHNGDWTFFEVKNRA